MRSAEVSDQDRRPPRTAPGRIGLPLPSLHDGHTPRHTPLRLSVFIEAPRGALGTIIDRHVIVRDLIDNGRLDLFRIDPELPLVEQRRAGAWVAAGTQALG